MGEYFFSSIFDIEMIVSFSALCIWSCLKKKPLHIIKDAHGINPNNFQPFWITAVASLLNTNLVASGNCFSTL